jgi:hypothetical protein
MPEPSPSRRRLVLVLVRDAALVALASTALGLGFNGLRANGIPLRATGPYEIFRPCPEATGKAEALEPGAIGPSDLLVDARSRAEHERWHPRGALSVPFDYLESTPPARVKQVAQTRSRRVVAFGDGGEPDSGAELARDLAGRGIRNVHYVRGGAPALRAQGGARR